MKTSNKRGTSFILILCLILTMMPLTPLMSVEAEAAQITTALDFTSLSPPTSGDGFAWNADSKTLTLSGIDLQAPDVSNGNSFGIKLPTGSTIYLQEGTVNTVRAGNTGGYTNYEDGYSYGIEFAHQRVEYTNTITGTGTLYAYGGTSVRGSRGIGCDNGTDGNSSKPGNVTIESGTIFATGGISTNSSVGIYANKTLTINGGSVTATTMQSGYGFGMIGYSGGVMITGGTVKAYGGPATDVSAGIYGTGSVNNLQISGGVVEAVGGTVSGIDINGNRNSAGLKSNQVIVISGGIVTATGGSVSLIDFTNKYNFGAKSYGIGSDDSGSVIISGGSVVAAVGYQSESNSYGVYSSHAPSFIGGTIHAFALSSATNYAIYTNEYQGLSSSFGNPLKTVITSPAGAGISANRQYIATSSGGSIAASDVSIVPNTSAPEMGIIGNSVGITDGDSSPADSDDTDFGTASVTDDTVVKTFTIQNSGTGELTLSSIGIGGTHASDFSVTQSPATTIANGASTTFQVTFDPSATGTRTATISIPNNDSDENPFDFSIQGTGYDSSTLHSFSYTGAVQTFTVPVTGDYRIELWGANGGTGSGNYIGGKGGYSKGVVHLVSGQIINLYVGGKGSNGTGDQEANGGWNGGGNGGYDTSAQSQTGGGGGGATDIRISGTALSDRTLVAGGGGGGGGNHTYAAEGGAGGGAAGNAGASYDVGKGGGGGTQTTGGSAYTTWGSIKATVGSLGNGGRGASGNGWGGGGGGGGYYGGGGGSCSKDHSQGVSGGGGGGSGYIGGVTSGITIPATDGCMPVNPVSDGNGYASIKINTVSGNADLSSLTATQGNLNPSFSSGTTTYAIEVANDITSIQFTPTVSDVNARAAINDVHVCSGTQSSQFNLASGVNTFEIVVVAEEGNTKTYTVTVTRASQTYTVSYHANGATSGTVPTDPNVYVQGGTVTASGNSGTLAKTGYTFSGWNTAANGSGTSYAIGVTFQIGAGNVTLYAKWTGVAESAKEDILSAKFTKDQLFDVQRSPAFPQAGQPIRISGMKAPYTQNYPTQVDLSNGNYVKFEYYDATKKTVGQQSATIRNSIINSVRWYFSDTTKLDKATVIKEVLYNSSNQQISVLSDFGLIWALQEQEGFLYTALNGSYKSSGGIGTFVSFKPYKFGSSITYVTPTSDPTTTGGIEVNNNAIPQSGTTGGITTASISGKIVDNANGITPLPGFNVNVTYGGVGYCDETDDKGNYDIDVPYNPSNKIYEMSIATGASVSSSIGGVIEEEGFGIDDGSTEAPFVEPAPIIIALDPTPIPLQPNIPARRYPVSASGITVSTNSLSPVENGKIQVTLGGSISGTVKYRILEHSPTTPNVGSLLLGEWTAPPSNSFTIAVTDGSFIEVAGVIGGQIASWGVSGATSDGYQASGSSNHDHDDSDSGSASQNPIIPGTPGAPGAPGTPGYKGNSGEIVIGNKPFAGGTAKNSKDGDKTITTVTFDEKKFSDLISGLTDGDVIRIPIYSNSDEKKGEFSAGNLNELGKKGADLMIQTDDGSFTLPAGSLDLDRISGYFNKQNVGTVDPKGIKIAITIGKGDEETKKLLDDINREPGFKVVLPPVKFIVTAEYQGKIMEFKEFDSYVERSVSLPAGTDPKKITSAVVVDQAGKIKQVPTRIILSPVSGQYIALVSSRSDQSFALVSNQVEFPDVANRWSKEAVNDMGSRMIISGINGLFYPDRDITRAEFISIMVNALGLPGKAVETKYSDLEPSRWFTPYAETAIAYGLAGGVSETRFGATDKVDRQQAMNMIARAMQFTEVYPNMSNKEVDAILSKYSDSNQISEYARISVAACLKTGAVKGKTATTIDPRASINRAEVASILRRLLQKSNLI